MRYIGFPSTQTLKDGKSVCFASRDEIVKSLFKAMLKSDYSEASLHSFYSNTLRKYVALCDENEIDIFSLESVSLYEDYLFEKYSRNEIKNSTYTREISDLTTLFSFLDKPSSWFKDVRVLGANQRESFEAYSQNDLKKLLPLLRGMFKQLAEQFIANPKSHIRANKQQASFSFAWQGKTFPIQGGMTKLAACATYLLAYYTWSNSSVIYNLKRPKLVSHSLSDTWYSMPAFKRRAFKTISVEIGEHQLEVPKYAMGFFDKLMEVSMLIDPSPEAFLIQTVIGGTHKPMCSNLLSDSIKAFIKRELCFTDDRNRPLHPVVSRFRETGSKLTIAKKGTMEAAILLDNTPNTVEANYSKGNEHENNKMVNETVTILETKIKNKSTVAEAVEVVKETLDLKILTYEEYLEKKVALARNAHGTYCQDSQGIEAEKFTRKAHKHNLSIGKKLVCADLLSCFECKHQAIVESVNDIWCLISFKECIEESKYSHLDFTHYQANFKKVLDSINKIIRKISKKVFRQAKLKMSEFGRHPLWLESNDLISIGGTHEA